ncbi:MAG: type I pullulanase [Elusimicrobia bacterium GWF2_52_66]|nr:MAG: type I pullulanase [Elusimicrobia bacterium GWF2_52_66]
MPAIPVRKGLGAFEFWRRCSSLTCLQVCALLAPSQNSKAPSQMARNYSVAALGAILMNVNLYAGNFLTAHYNRLNGDYQNWNLWVWNEGGENNGFEIEPSGKDDAGVYFKIDLKTFGLLNKKTGFLPKYGNWEKQDGPDRILKTAKEGDIYLMEGDMEVYSAPPEVSTKIVSASFESENEVKLALNRVVNLDFLHKQGFYLKKGENSAQALKARFYGGGKYGKAVLLEFDSFGKLDPVAVNAGLWQAHARDLKPVKVELGSAVYGPDFASTKRMGAFTSDGMTVMRIFAPKATKVSALIYETSSGTARAESLQYSGHGLWEKVFDRDLAGKYYRLRVTTAGRVREGLDPYAACVTADNGRALIVRDDTPVADTPSFDLSETVFYEVHIRDFSSDAFSGIKNKGGYLGFTQEGTKHPLHPEIKTGLDHLAELGVNAVHILPFADFENADGVSGYNWGYMPVNFNSPEGAYATRTDDASRVRETKLMIDALHKKGIKAIMDVVYNHTAETGGKIYNFRALAGDYYYRLRPDGSYWNGSGCGNEFKTEAPMVRKFIIDSLLHWARDYKVDGFRFDLMGLMDRETAFEVVKKLKEFKPDIVIYGEPWAAGATPVNGVKKGSQKGRGFAVFNDEFRDALKGSVFNVKDPGYIQSYGQNYLPAVRNGIMGSPGTFAGSPLESVNYVSCHDNNTLWDRIDLLGENAPAETKIKMDKLAQAIVFTSQGIPLLHAGEEFLRTKKGEENSFNLPDKINKLDWTRKKDYFSVFSYYRDLIALRKAHPAFRMKTAAAVKENLEFYDDIGLALEAPDIAYMLYGDKAGDAWSRILVLINPRDKSRKFTLPMGEWEQAFDENGFYKGEKKKIKAGFEVPPVSLAVLYQ